MQFDPMQYKKWRIIKIIIKYNKVKKILKQSEKYLRKKRKEKISNNNEIKVIKLVK